MLLFSLAIEIFSPLLESPPPFDIEAALLMLDIYFREFAVLLETIGFFIENSNKKFSEIQP